MQTCQARRQQQAKENFEKDESREDKCVKGATIKSITLDVEPWDKEVDLNEVENQT